MQQIGLANLSPAGGAQSNRYSRARSIGTSPPDSPRLPVSRGTGEFGKPSTANLSTTALAGAASNSSLNLNLNPAPQSRAPSAFLEDLFESGVGAGTTEAGAVAPVPKEDEVVEERDKDKGERRRRRRSKGHRDEPRRKSRSGHHSRGGDGTADRRSRGY